MSCQHHSRFLFDVSRVGVFDFRSSFFDIAVWRRESCLFTRKDNQRLISHLSPLISNLENLDRQLSVMEVDQYASESYGADGSRLPLIDESSALGTQCPKDRWVFVKTRLVRQTCLFVSAYYRLRHLSAVGFPIWSSGASFLAYYKKIMIRRRLRDTLACWA